jgi:uncharacterized membrane protein YtjA (UPF0391 family)
VEAGVYERGNGKPARPLVGFGACRVTKVGTNLRCCWARSGRALDMLSWAVLFLVIAIIAAIFGFGGIAGTAAGIAQVLFYIFIAIFIISLLVGLARGRRP